MNLTQEPKNPIKMGKKRKTTSATTTTPTDGAADWRDTHTKERLRTGIVRPLPGIPITPKELAGQQRNQNNVIEGRYARLLIKLDNKLCMCRAQIKIAMTVEPMDYAQEMSHVQDIEDAFRYIFDSGENFLHNSFLMRNVINMAEKDPMDHKYDVEDEKDEEVEEDEEDEKDG
jgi:hypothetical protein